MLIVKTKANADGSPPATVQEQRQEVSSNDTDCDALEALVDGRDCCLFALFPSGWTLLHIAARYGKGTVIQSLINAGLSVNASTNDGRQPLHVAARSGNKAAVIVLTRAGVFEKCRWLANTLAHGAVWLCLMFYCILSHQGLDHGLENLLDCNSDKTWHEFHDS